MARYRFCLYLTFLLWHINSFPQHLKKDAVDFFDQKMDTAKVNMLNRLCNLMYNEDIEKSLEYAQKALDAAGKINYPNGIALSSRYIGNYYHDNNDYKKAATFYNTSLRISDSLKLYDEIVLNLFELGNLHKKLGHLSSALDYFEKILTYRNFVKDKSLIAMPLGNIAATLYECQKFKESLDFYLQSLDTLKKYSSMCDMSLIFSNIGSCFTTFNQLDSALKYSNMALKEAGKTPESKQYASVYRQHGFIYEAKKDY